MAKDLAFILLAALFFDLLAATFSAAHPLDSTTPRYSMLHAGANTQSRHRFFLPLQAFAAAPGFASQPGSGAPALAAASLPPGENFPELVAQGGAEGDPGAAKKRQWRWRRMGGTEYATVSMAVVATAYFEHENGRPTDADWTSRNEFDEEIRSALRLDSRAARDVAGIAGDALMGVMIAAPVLDAFATLGIRDRDWDTLWQTEMVNLEAFTFTSLVSSLTQNLLARERPFVRDCRGGECNDRLENRGFPSGHVAFAFTGAGLLCNHHAYQSLYRDPAADRAVCSAGIGVAVADGVLRILSDSHYATDVAAGTLLGLFSGFVLPRLLHYNHPVEKAAAKKQDAAPATGQIRLVPLLTGNATGLSCEFRF